MNKIKEFINNLWCRCDWHIEPFTAFEIAMIPITALAMLWANPQWFVEDGVVENIQLLALFFAFMIACRAKNSKKMFMFFACIVLFMIMRETNLFRAYFCEKYLTSDTLCRWDAFKYGYLVSGGRSLFAIFILYYFLRYKIWKDIWRYAINAPVYVWDFIILAISVIGGTVAEFACVDNEILEECCELISYLALTNCIYKYTKFDIQKAD